MRIIDPQRRIAVAKGLGRRQAVHRQTMLKHCCQPRARVGVPKNLKNLYEDEEP